MEDEKELIKKIKNSFAIEKSQAQIIKSLQKKGCTLEYAQALITKSKKPKKILLTFLITIIILASLTIATLSIITPTPSISNGESTPIKNPLKGFSVIFGEKQNQSTSQKEDTQREIYLDEIQITPEFIAYLLSEIKANELLHKNPLTRKNPLINFRIEEIIYSSELSETILISPELNPEADIQFNTNKETIVRATLSDNPSQVFKDSVISGTTTIEKISTDADLLAKGYLDLYEQFK
jgi:hypothetical protein